MRQLVEPCLYNWLGYGNTNGKYWFIGTEEGGAEAIGKNKTMTLEASLKKRAKFQLAMDFKSVWEDEYGILIANYKGPTVWRFIAAFMLAFEGVEPAENRAQIRQFMNQHLGNLQGNHFLCELYPLPKSSKGQICPYEAVWPTLQDYYDEIQSRRFQMITETLAANPNAEYLISYEKKLSELLLERFKTNIRQQVSWKVKKQAYRLSRLELPGKREIQFLETPFFGNGCISYEGVWQSAQRILEN